MFLTDSVQSIKMLLVFVLFFKHVLCSVITVMVGVKHQFCLSPAKHSGCHHVICCRKLAWVTVLKYHVLFYLYTFAFLMFSCLIVLFCGIRVTKKGNCSFYAFIMKCVCVCVCVCV